MQRPNCVKERLYVGSGTEIHLCWCFPVATSGIAFALIDMNEVYVDSTTEKLVRQYLFPAQSIVVNVVAGAQLEADGEAAREFKRDATQVQVASLPSLASPQHFPCLRPLTASTFQCVLVSLSTDGALTQSRETDL